MLLSAECTVEVVKHMLSNKERGMLRRTCKAFRNVRIQTDLFQKAYFEFLKSNNIQLTLFDGKLIIKSPDNRVYDPYVSFMRSNLRYFADTVRGLYIDELTPDSRITIKMVYRNISTHIKAIHETTTTDNERRCSCGGYLLGHTELTVQLITREETSNSPFGRIVRLPNRIPCYDEENIYENTFDYIEYPKLILSSSDN